MTLIILDVNSKIACEEGMAARIVLAVLAAGLMLPFWAAAAPRDAVAYMPRISNETKISSYESAQDGVGKAARDELFGQWRLSWSPREVRLGNAYVRTSLDYVVTLNDRAERLSQGTTDNRVDSYDFDLKLDADPLVVTHHLHREDRTHASRLIESDQLNWSRADLKLPFNAQLSFYDHIQRNYGGSTDQPDRPTQSQSGTNRVELKYLPRTADLSQRLEFSSEKSYSFNPALESGTDDSRVEMYAEREWPVGQLGNLHWSYKHVEQDKVLAGTQLPTTELEEQHVVRLQNTLPKTPLTYSVAVADSVKDLGTSLPSKHKYVSQLQMKFEPSTSSGRTSSVSLTTRFEEQDEHLTTDGGDFSILTSDLGWSFQPHRLIKTGVHIHTLQRNSDFAARSENRKDSYQISGEYTLPGGAGQISFLARNENEEARSSVRDEQAWVLTNRLVLSRASSIGLTFENRQTSIAAQGAVQATPTEYVRTGINYRLSSDVGLDLDATWSQSLQLRGGSDYRFDTDNLNVTLGYRPDPSARYTLTIISTDENERDLTLPGSSHYSSSDEIVAGVSFTF